MDEIETTSVLFLLSSLRTGGSEAKTVRLANTLAERGMRVTLAYLGPFTSLRNAVSPQVELVHLKRRGKLSVRALRMLIGLIRERQVQTVVAVNLYPTLYAALARISVGRRRPRFVASVNTTDIRTWKLALQMHLYRYILRTADLVIFGAEAQRRIWRERYGVGAAPGKSRVIYNGVDTNRFAPLSADADPSTARLEPTAARADTAGVPLRNRFLVGTVGQLRPEKSQVDLLRAAAMLRARGFDVGVLLVGEGPERARLQAQIDSLGLRDHAALAGECRDVRPFLHALDVFVLPSTAIETFSNAALEALATGVPVIGAEVGGMRELISYGGGMTYPPGDVQRLVDCVTHLLSDDARRLRMGREARRAALEQFGWERMVEEFTSVLRPAALEEERGTVLPDGDAGKRACDTDLRPPAAHSLRESA